jgi:hypothetical protein
MRKGTKCRIKYDGRSVDAWILLASDNDKSLAVGFDAMIDGHCGMMPLLSEHPESGLYRSVLTGKEYLLEIAP